MFKEIYNLSKKPNFHEELKDKLESLSQSIKQSNNQSPKEELEEEQDSLEIPELDFDGKINSNLNDY